MGLVLVGSAVSGAPGPDSAQQARISKLSDSIDEAEEAEDLDLVNELECHLWLDGPESTKGRVGGELRTLFLAMNGRALRAGDIGEAIWAMDSWNRLEELNVPTTVIVGDLDLPHIVERSTTMARRIPGATLVEVNEVAHLVAFEDPIGFSELLTSFLGSLTIIGHEAAHGLVDRDGHRQPRQPR